MASPLPTPFALQTWTLRHQLDRTTCDEVLASVRSIGYTAIEVSARGGMRLDSFLSSARKAGLTCIGVHIPCFCGLDMQTSRPVVDRVIDDMQKTYEREQPKNWVLTVMGNPEYLQDTEERYRRFSDLLGELNQHYAKSLPTRCFAYHLYDFDLTAAPECIGHILRAGCHLVLDSFYLWRSKMTWDDALCKFGNTVIACHVNDHTGHGAQCSLGDGVEQWPNAMSIMGQFARCEWLVIEHDPSTEHGLDLARRSAKFLRASPSVDVFWRNRSVSR